jgi:DNA polymerase III subunit gamma/tau
MVLSVRGARVAGVEAPLALYRRYRPETFSEVIGQDHVTAPLRNALSNNRVNHAYLFSGPRGCGKTTSARILARAINCEKGPIAEPCGVCKSCTDLARGGPGSIDVIEIDAASHGGVDDARDLRERAFFAPVESRYKIYIIDEAHMVTTQGFNALLKLVEEPPPHLKFIFATTEPDKVIGTIRSRTHHYPFRLVPPKVLGDYMASLCESEGVAIEPAALPLVVRAGAGSVRDSLSVLDQLIGGAGPAGVTYELAVALLGFTPDSLLDACVDGFAAHDSKAVFETIEKVIETGQDPKRFAEDLLRRLRDLVVLSAVPNAVASGLIEAAEDQGERLQTQAAGIGSAELTRAADIVAAGLLEMRGATAPRLQLELICAKVLLPGADDSTNGIQARLDRMERRLTIGAPASTTDAVPPAQPAGAPAAPDSFAGAPAGGAGSDAAANRAVARAAATGSGTASTGAAAGDAPAGAGAGRDTASSGAAGAAAAARGAVGGGTAAGSADRAETARGPSAGAGNAASSGVAGRTSAGAQGRTGAWPDESPASLAPAGGSAGGPAQESGHGASGPAVSGSAAAPGASGRPTEAGAAGGGAPASAGSVGLADVRRLWPQVLESVKAKRRFAWIMLSQNAQVIAIDDQTLTLGLVNAGARESFARSGSDEILRQALIDTIGLNRRVEAVVDPSTDPGAGGAGGHHSGAPRSGGPHGGGAAGGSGGGAGAAGTDSGGWGAGPGGAASGGAGASGGPTAAGGPGASPSGATSAGASASAGDPSAPGVDGPRANGPQGVSSGNRGAVGQGTAGSPAGDGASQRSAGRVGPEPADGASGFGGPGGSSGSAGQWSDSPGAAIALQEPPPEYDVPPEPDPWDDGPSSRPGSGAGQSARPARSAGRETSGVPGTAEVDRREQAASKRRAAEAAVAAEQARRAAAPVAAEAPLSPEEEADAIGEDDMVLEEDSRSHTDLLRETLGAQIITEEPN